MAPPAARQTDNVLHDAPHCHAPIHPPAPTPTPVPHPPIPFPIVGMTVPTVMIGGLPAAVVGSMTQNCMIPPCVPAGPGIVAKGSATVMIGMRPAARVGDMVGFATCVAPIPSPTGKILPPGAPTVMIGGCLHREHFERLRPVCAACREAPLSLGTVAREDGADVLEGVLLCPACDREHPIVDGIPVVVGDLMSWAGHQLPAVLRRDDLTPFTESLLGDAAGAASALDRERSNLSGYGHAHWGGGGFDALVNEATALLEAPPQGVWADLGCATGRGTLELARTCELAVGVDLSFAMLRVAERVRREGRARFPLRRVGIAYDRVDLPISDVPSGRMTFWCCDVGVLPLPDASLDGALSLNVLDCAASPMAHLAELRRTLRPGAPALLSTPFDWSPAATPVEQWIGGHSQRGPSEARSEDVLRHALEQVGLSVDAERDGVPWSVRANERSRVDYDLLLLRLKRA